jgi:hypothetical protein
MGMVCYMPIVISLWLSTRPIRLTDLARKKSHLQNVSSMELSYTVLIENSSVSEYRALARHEIAVLKA